MNIGPKGDGAFDQKDMDILIGIGDWLHKNGESIYGTTVSPLPYHSWGVSTIKNNKIYLHVFDWPQDGKLYVSGFTQISNGHLLAAPGVNIKMLKTKHGDHILVLPKQRPDSIDAVIVFDWKGQRIPDSVHLVVPNTRMERFLAFDAKQSGKGFNYGDGKTDRYYVEGWKSRDQFLSWQFRTVESKPQKFKMIIKYLAPEESSGGTYSVTVDRNTEPFYKSSQTVTTEPKNTTVITRDLGLITLTNGTYVLKIVPESISKLELMKILEVVLIKTN